MSTMWSAAYMVSSSCSTMMSVFPMSVRLRSDARSLSLSLWCRPIDGSSRMYRTPTRPDPIWVARRMRCDSPPDSVFADRLSVRYPRPTSFRKLSLALISLVTILLIFLSRSLSSVSNFSKNSSACTTERSVSSMMFLPPTVTASTVSLSLRPLQTGHSSSVIMSLILLLMYSELVSPHLRSRLGMTPSNVWFMCETLPERLSYVYLSLRLPVP